MEVNQNPSEESAIAIRKAVKTSAKEVIEENGGSEKVLVIRHDKPQFILPVYEPVKYAASGVIDTVFRYLEKRVELIDQLDTTIKIDREKMSISMVVHDKDHFSENVSGKLSVHPDFEKFNINNGEQKTPEKWGDFFRMNRSFFQSKSENLGLVAKLKGFTANVQKVVEEKMATNGNRKSLMDQVVTHNLPDAFKLNLPLFRGQPAKSIEVEIVIDSQSLDASLESPEANEFMDKVKNEAIDEQIELIKGIAPQVLIIEI